MPLTRQAVARVLKCSLATVRRLERVDLHPQVDERGVHLFDEGEVSEVAAKRAGRGVMGAPSPAGRVVAEIGASAATGPSAHRHLSMELCGEVARAVGFVIRDADDFEVALRQLIVGHEIWSTTSLPCQACGRPLMLTTEAWEAIVDSGSLDEWRHAACRNRHAGM